MKADRNIILVGFMGTGKSTVGREVARQLSRRFVDLDEEIVLAAGRPIPQIFADEGESGFRKWERGVVKRYSVPKNLVLATGGGIVLNVANTESLAEAGILICLDASVESILKRVERDRRRPLLQTPDREQRVRELLSERMPYYEAVKHHIATDGLSHAEVADRVIALVTEAAALHPDA